MKILVYDYLTEYQKALWDISFLIEKFLASSKRWDFLYLTESSSVYSSNIEGNTLDLNSFMNTRMRRDKPKDAIEIENLIEAYEFAQTHELTEVHFLHAHARASRTLLIPSKQWIYRDEKIGVFGKEWLIYLAIEAEFVNEKMRELFVDIAELLQKNLTPEEDFYFASLIHLKFIHIHPFADWNGRLARLLEKWFLAEKLGKDFWKISSEQYYKEHRSEYYRNINLGVNYYELDYSQCLPFLLMLTKSLSL